MVQKISSHNSQFSDPSFQLSNAERQRLQQNRQLLLAQLAQGNSLQWILNSLIQRIESADPSLTGAVFLRQTESDRLDLIAAPSLDPLARDALLRAEPHVGGGICGQAVLSGERIEFIHFGKHPCPACRQLGGLPQFQACWAEPISNQGGETIGVFAFYCRLPKHPDLRQIALLKHSASLARISIEGCRETLALTLAQTNWQSAQQAIVGTDLAYRVQS